MPFDDLLPQKSSSYFALHSTRKSLRRNDRLFILQKKLLKCLYFEMEYDTLSYSVYFQHQEEPMEQQIIANGKLPQIVYLDFAEESTTYRSGDGSCVMQIDSL